ncbi:hypothetical protein NQZ79_g5137 [Umbelopsis isabellina]|nr:hypothetical protein NQZ79_g5137 [Umbelopsis isabellina]
MLSSSQGIIAIPKTFNEPTAFEDDLQYTFNRDYKDDYNEEFHFHQAGICPQAPPPSPQEPSLLEAVFAQRLSNTLKSVVEARRRSSLASVQSARLPSPPPAAMNSHEDAMDESNIVVEDKFAQHAGALNEMLRKITSTSGRIKKIPNEVHRRRRSKRPSRIPIASIRLPPNNHTSTFTLQSSEASPRESKAKRQQLQRTADAASKMHMLKSLSSGTDHEKSAVLEELIYELKDMGL